MSAPVKTPKLKKYKTKATSSVLFDILVKGETIYGQWDDEKHVVFDVPEGLVEGFETHWHFQVGNIVAA